MHSQSQGNAEGRICTDRRHIVGQRKPGEGLGKSWVVEATHWTNILSQFGSFNPKVQGEWPRCLESVIYSFCFFWKRKSCVVCQNFLFDALYFPEALDPEVGMRGDLSFGSDDSKGQ